MKMILNISLCYIILLNILGCKSESDLPLAAINESPFIWEQLITTTPASALNSTPMYFNGSIIVGKNETLGYMVRALNAENGDSLWNVILENIGGFNPIEEESFLHENKVILSDDKRTFVIDASNGNLLWKHESEFMRGTSCVIDEYVYKANNIEKSTSTMYRFDINSGLEEKLFTISRWQYGSKYSPNLLMPVQWVHPSGDKILVLQNRTYGWYLDGKHKMDILAWNLTADTMLWYRESLDGFSSMSRPAISGDKVYFYGDHHAHCINPLNGETIWKYFIGNGPEDDFNTANILVVEDKLIVKPDNQHMHAVNKETGERIWTNENTEAMPGFLTVHKDTIWFCSAGIFGIDANTGEKLIDDWNNRGYGSWIFPVAHHPTNGNIYTSDARNLYCLDPKYLK